VAVNDRALPPARKTGDVQGRAQAVAAPHFIVNDYKPPSRGLIRHLVVFTGDLSQTDQQRIHAHALLFLHKVQEHDFRAVEPVAAYDMGDVHGIDSVIRFMRGLIAES
jgi:hypothetical protein